MLLRLTEKKQAPDKMENNRYNKRITAEFPKASISTIGITFDIGFYIVFNSLQKVGVQALQQVPSIYRL